MKLAYTSIVLFIASPFCLVVGANNAACGLYCLATVIAMVCKKQMGNA